MSRIGRRRVLRGGVVLAAGGLMAGCGLVSIQGQRPAGPRRIGYLDSDFRVTAGIFNALRAGLRDLGYIEEQNLVIEYRDAEGHLERLPALATELLGVPVELIVVPNPIAAGPASQATTTTPIVAAGGNVVGARLVANVAHPEANLTGVASNNVETAGKWIELLKETVPALSHVGVLLDPQGPTAQVAMQHIERAAQSLQLRSVSYALPDLDRLAAVLATAKADRVDGLVVLSGGVLGSSSNPQIGGDLLRAHLPAVAEQRGFAVAGGLLAHGPNTVAMARRSASYVDKILKGAVPGDLPIELPTEFTIVVNLKTAQVLGLTIPQEILAQATEVIQ